MTMRLCALTALAMLVMAPTATPAAAGVQDQVRMLVEAGEIMPFEPIRNRVASQVKGDYIGADFDLATRTYRFRFLVDGSVINVDVDARNGQRVRRSSF